MAFAIRKKSILPGFGLTMGYTLVYLSLVVLIPLAAMVFKTTQLSFKEFWTLATEPHAVASYLLTFGSAAVAGVVNAFFGFIVAWTLVRYSFPGKKIVDAMVDLPFALPTAVSGIALTALYAPTGWIGKYLQQWNDSPLRESMEKSYLPAYQWLHETFLLRLVTWIMPTDLEVKAAYSQLGVMIAMTFIGLPFVVRTLQPTLEDLDPEVEEAAASLGATRFQVFRKIILPTVMPSLLTGFALAFARAVGEYGSLVFIAPNSPITSLLIYTKLENHLYAEATAIATVMLFASFLFLFLINGIQWWATRRYREGA
jgi:sulfate transport system permease protein